MEFINVGVALIERNKEILIVKKAKDSFCPSKWEFPSGYIKKGESITKGLCREMKEELKIEVWPNKKGLCLSYEYDFLRSNRKIHRFFALWCEILKGEPALTVYEELAWVNIKDLSLYDPFIEPDKKLIEHIVHSKLD